MDYRKSLYLARPILIRDTQQFVNCCVSLMFAAATRRQRAEVISNVANHDGAEKQEEQSAGKQRHKYKLVAAPATR